MAKLEVQGGARLEHDEDTGRPYWALWGADWKDGEDLEPGECVRLSPDAFPPGTSIEILEPGPDDPRSQKFYADLLDRHANRSGATPCPDPTTRSCSTASGP